MNGDNGNIINQYNAQWLTSTFHSHYFNLRNEVATPSQHSLSVGTTITIQISDWSHHRCLNANTDIMEKHNMDSNLLSVHSVVSSHHWCVHILIVIGSDGIYDVRFFSELRHFLGFLVKEICSSNQCQHQ